MERLDFPARIVEFRARFADGAACLGYVAASRWLEGFSCPARGGGQT